ncbi:MAG: RNA-guided pseudouridylation complex pseudouridine synthase subunit Cbf5 [Thermoplasmatota archaeon]
MPEIQDPSLVQRKRLVRVDFSSDPGHGSRPSDRSVGELLKCGVVVLDKPAGPTSHQVAAWARDILSVERAGHGGTLDPAVTGVLPVTLERATKAVGALLYASKEYVCYMKLHREVRAEKVRSVLSEFEDEIFQVPPVRSAVKRQQRSRRVYSLRVLEIDGRDVLFRVSCQAGTYIRTLCQDVGEVLGVGAHMQELRRVRTARFTEDRASTLHDLKDAFIFWRDGDERALRRAVLPMEALLEHMPAVVIRDGAVDAICHGARLALPGVVALDSGIERGSKVAVHTAKGEGVAIGRAEMTSDEMMELSRGVAVTPERVLMAPGTYPKGWRSASAD